MRSLLGLTHAQVHQNAVVKPERSRREAATVASNLGYLPEPRNVSTVLLNPPRTSLSHSFALYQTLMASLRVTAMAVRHSRGRGGKKGEGRA